jgi:hypothetical protein
MSESQTRAVTVNQAFWPSQENTEGALVAYTDKKGNSRELTLEGALWKGGDAMKQLKSDALDSALAKAVGGRYRAAFDIVVAAFPSIQKSLENLHIGTPWGNKSSMGTVVLAVMGQRPKAGKDFSAKQKEAIALVRAMLNIPAFEHLKPQGEVVGEATEQQSN